MNFSNIALVVVAYKKRLSLEKLLDSIKYAEIPQNTDLYISIDGNGHESVIQLVKNFSDPRFNIKIIINKTNLGLKNHIINCANIVKNYDGVILLEDDILIDKFFYNFASHALNFYKTEVKVSGVSLYSMRTNELNNLPFLPIKTNFSNYFAILPSSWGIAFSKEQWSSFVNWYESIPAHEIDSLCLKHLPKKISLWPQSSWKKIYTLYNVLHNYVWVYPYESFATNNGGNESGTHVKKNLNWRQVPIQIQERLGDKYHFCEYDKSAIIYDEYLEQKGLIINKLLNLSDDISVACDFYGLKQKSNLENYNIVITSKRVSNYIESYPLRKKPFELVLTDRSIENANDEIFLTKPDNIIFNKKSSKLNTVKLLNYLTGYEFFSKIFLKDFIKFLLSSTFHRIKKL